jgi:hypothetical protein
MAIDGTGTATDGTAIAIAGNVSGTGKGFVCSLGSVTEQKIDGQALISADGATPGHSVAKAPIDVVLQG